jgi:hypothetical protein
MYQFLDQVGGLIPPNQVRVQANEISFPPPCCRSQLSVMGVPQVGGETQSVMVRGFVWPEHDGQDVLEVTLRQIRDSDAQQFVRIVLAADASKRHRRELGTVLNIDLQRRQSE